MPAINNQQSTINNPKSGMPESYRILIVDDEQEILDALEIYLSDEGFQVSSALSGEEAIKIFKSASFDLVITDIKMPGIDGVEVMRQVKKMDEDVEVIVMTGHGTLKSAIQVLRVDGAFDYLMKPLINIDEFIHIVNKALEKRRLLLENKEKTAELEKANEELCIEIAQRKRAEEAVQEAHEELGKLFQELRRDYEIAERVFANVIRPDHIESKHMKYLLSPMDIVGGDLILTAAGPSGSQYVFVGDFTGHGLSAAIGAIPVSDLFYTMAGKGHSIEKIVKESNRKLKSILPTGLFLCACFMELDYIRGTLTAWNGGLPDALIIGGQEGIKKRLPSRHLPLGVVSNEKSDTGVEVVKLAQGDFIYIYTDGVIEAVNNQGEMFGQERLEEYFTHIREPEALFDEICRSLAAFRSGGVQEDDISIIEIRYDAEAVTRFNGKAISEPEEVSTGWRLALDLGPESLRTNELLPQLMGMLIGAHRGLYDHKENIYLIVSELFSNALEWGVLGLNSRMKKDPEGFEAYYAARERALAALDNGRIKIDFELFDQGKGGKLVVRIEDSGPGFNCEKVMSKHADDTSLGGRGITLVRSFCKELVYKGKGNRVEAVYVWS